MSEIISVNMLPPVWGKCRCGAVTFKLQMDQNGQRVVALVCAKCGDSECVIDPPDFEIDCEID